MGLELSGQGGKCGPRLRHVEADALPLRRVPRGRGFSYHDAEGNRIADAATLARIRSLVIPPAYREVRIAASPRDHIQAVGRDDAGRLQYLYHPDWEAVRLAQKTDRLATLCAALPHLRRTVDETLRQEGLGRDKVMAAVVLLIDRTHIRIGSEAYVHTGRSRGATTLLKRHVRIVDGCARLTFHGKRRTPIACEIDAPAFLDVLRQLRRLPGRRLFQYRDGGTVRRVHAADVNDWIHGVAGARVSAKDFRTLAASAVAVELFAAMAPDQRASNRKSQIAGVMKEIAAMLVNTPAVARSSYVHPAVVDAFLAGDLAERLAACRSAAWLSRREAAVAELVGA